MAFRGRELVLGASVALLVACARLADLDRSSDKENGGTVGRDRTFQDDASVRQPIEGGVVIESPINLEGDVRITPESLEFGPVACGVAATEQTITIVNTSKDPLTWTAALPPDGGFVLRGPTSGQLAANGLVRLPISVLPRTAGDLNGGILISAGKSYLEVIAHATGLGGVLEFVPSTVDFGEIRKGNAATPIPVLLKNTGTGAAVVTGVSGKSGGLDLDWPGGGSLTINPGATGTMNAQFAPPNAVGAVRASLTPTVTSPLCAARPPLSSKGAAIDTTVSISGADFGTPSCNTTPPNKAITVSNYSTSTLSLTSFSSPSRFSIVTSAPVAVPAAVGTTPGIGTITVAVGPTGTSLGLVEEDFSLTIQGLAAPDGGTKTTKLRIDVRGAILKIDPDRLDFMSNGSSTDSKRFPITNIGNATVRVSYDFMRTKGAAAWFPDRDTVDLAPNVASGIDMGFRPSDDGEHEATLTPRRVSGAVVCTPMPVATARGVVP